MIDALEAYLPEARVSPDVLQSVKPLYRGEGFRGVLGNLRAIQTGKGVFIQGSLPKFLNGENVRTLTRQGGLAALDKLERESGLDLRKGFVYRLEVGATLPVKDFPKNYLAAWGPLGRFRKDVYANGETVLYRTKARSFQGYDKGAEHAPEALPAPLEGRYALRLELKYKAALRRVLGRPMNAWELLEPEVYHGLVERWRDFYFSIPKRKEPVIKMDKMTTKSLERSLAALGLQVLGMDRINQIIKDGKAFGTVDRTTATRMRQLVRELEKDPNVGTSEPLTLELDEKVRSVSRFAR